MSDLETLKRSCGECDVCCRGWLKIDTDEFKVPIGEQCPHLSETLAAAFMKHAQ